MFTFSKPQRTEEDLMEWEEYFIKKHKFCVIIQRLDGLYELRVEGVDAFILHPVYDNEIEIRV